MAHEERFIPERQKLDQLGVVKDYAAVPRLEYRYVRSFLFFSEILILSQDLPACLRYIRHN